MLQKLLLVLFLLACAGLPAVYFLLPPDFGVSPDHPLGEYDKIEKWFLGRDYVKSMKMVDDEFLEEHGAAFRGSRIFKFSWQKQRESAYSRTATIIVTPAGRVRGIGASFYSGRAANRPPEVTPEKFVWHLWQQIAGREPDFRYERESTESRPRFFHVDSLNTNGVKGEWKKEYRVPGRENSIFDAVQLWVDDGEDDK